MYIEQAEQQGWEVLWVQPVRSAWENGYTITEIKAHYLAGDDLEKLPSHKVPSNDPSDTGGCAAIPPFLIEQFHEYLAAFIAADDQVSEIVILGCGTELFHSPLTLLNAQNFVTCCYSYGRP